MVSHAQVVRLFTATQPWFHFDQYDVWTFFHSFAFDFSVWEIWGALLHGGRLVVVPYWVSRSPEAFYDLLISENVTVLNQTPSAFYQLIQAEQALPAAAAPSLRLVIFGGEALELQKLKPWFERHKDNRQQLVNMYGITETTVHVTYRPIAMADIESGLGSVIGKRIPDLQVYILNNSLQPVPVGVPGEVYVGGAGLARGYLNRAEVTAERFLPHPYSREEGERLYKTGDLARYLPHGDIEYLGRRDQQVKLRGYRIELGEIEAVLAAHPLVQQAVVISSEDIAGAKRLAAYVVPQAGEAPSANQLRRHLREKLPEYMLPAVFVTLEALPLTVNGKLNRRALPAPEQAGFDSERIFVAPRTTVEVMLAEVYAEVLGIDRIGANDNFFELGGHSLLATQLISHVRQAFDVHLPLVNVFDKPILSDLAALIERSLVSEIEELSKVRPDREPGRRRKSLCGTRKEIQAG
jgi:acyl-coenzyme A synthetase/AMP-(fatty) acid ligase/acyl carrier protein